MVVIPDHLLNIDNSNIIRLDRVGKSGGGVAIYVKNNYPASRGGVAWSDTIGSSLRGRGEDSAGDDLDRRISSTSGVWNHGSQSSAYGLKKAYVSQGSLDPIWGRQGWGVCGESKANSTG